MEGLKSFNKLRHVHPEPYGHTVCIIKIQIPHCVIAVPMLQERSHREINPLNSIFKTVSEYLFYVCDFKHGHILVCD